MWNQYLGFMRRYNDTFLFSSVLAKSNSHFHIYLSLRNSNTVLWLWKIPILFRKVILMLKSQISHGWTSDWGFSGNDCEFYYCTKWSLYYRQQVHVTAAWFDALIIDTSRKPTFGDIKVEEVTVEDCLDHSRYNGNHVEEALKIETPDPIEEIEGSIQAQAEQVVGGDCLRLTGLANHEELRQNCHRLQIDGECPKNLMTEMFNLNVNEYN